MRYYYMGDRISKKREAQLKNAVRYYKKRIIELENEVERLTRTHTVNIPYPCLSISSFDFNMNNQDSVDDFYASIDDFREEIREEVKTTLLEKILGKFRK